MKKITIFIVLIFCLALTGCSINSKLSEFILNEPEKETKDLQNKDTDNDGLSDYDEINTYKTDLNNSDTDGDGYLDGEEVKNGYSPTEVVNGAKYPTNLDENNYEKEDAKLKLDDAKTINDVKFISGQLDYYYSQNKKFPESLSEISMFSNIRSPKGDEYVYKRIGNNDYELCFYINNEMISGRKNTFDVKKGKNCVNTSMDIK